MTDFHDLSTAEKRAVDRHKRFRPVKAKTINHRDLVRLVREDNAGGDPQIAAIAKQLPVIRPKTRAECSTVPRPCPFVGCRHNLYLEVARNGSLKLKYPDLEPHEMPVGASCVLDLVEHRFPGGATLPEIAEHLNVTMELVRQCEVVTFRKVRTHKEKLL